MVNISRAHYLASLLLGAVFGVGAAIFNTKQMILLLPFVAFQDIYANVILIVVAVMIAPFAEELVKILPPFFLKTQENIEPSVIEWVQLGVVSALGFSLLENLSYFFTFINIFGMYGAVWLLLLRFLLSTPLHLTTTTIAAYGVGSWDNYGENEYFLFLIIAMIIHSLYNLGTIMLGL